MTRLRAAMTDAFTPSDAERGGSALRAALRAKDVTLEKARRAFARAKAALAQADGQVASSRALLDRHGAARRRELSGVRPRSGDDLARWDAYRRRCDRDAESLAEQLHDAVGRRDAARAAVDAASRELAQARADVETVRRRAADRAERARRRAADRADDERHDDHLARRQRR